MVSDKVKCSLYLKDVNRDYIKKIGGSPSLEPLIEFMQSKNRNLTFKDILELLENKFYDQDYEFYVKYVKPKLDLVKTLIQFEK